MNPRARMRRKAARRFFGYDAAGEHAMRRQPAAHERSEDDELPPDKRRKVVSRARDARRNQEIAAWAIRKHLDFTSDFRFRSDTGVKPLDDEINAFVDWWSLAENCDATGREPPSGPSHPKVTVHSFRPAEATLRPALPHGAREPPSESRNGDHAVAARAT